VVLGSNPSWPKLNTMIGIFIFEKNNGKIFCVYPEVKETLYLIYFGCRKKIIGT